MPNTHLTPGLCAYSSALLVAVTGSLPACGGTGGGSTSEAIQADSGGTPVVGLAGKCLDVREDVNADGTQVQLYTCNGTNAQKWTYQNNQLINAGGRCLDVSDANSANGTKVQIYDCNGTDAQQWIYENGELVGIAGKCLDVTGENSADSTPVQLWSCWGGPNQMWTLSVPAAPPPVDAGPSNPPPPPPASDASSNPPTTARGQQCSAYVKAAPTNGGQEYVVDGTNGSDSNNGSANSPFQTVQKAANVAQAGDVVTILAGTYTELVNVQNSGASGAPIVFQADQCGQTIFTGNTGFYPQVEASPTVNNGGCIGSGPGQHDITLSGLNFQGTHDSPGSTSSQLPNYSAVIYMVDNWRLTNISIDGSDDLEVNVRGTGDIIEQSTFMHGGSHSLVGCGGNTIVRNVINGNNVTNTAAAANCGDSCSTKFLFTNGMLIDNIESYGNNGAGWWFDTDNVNFTIQNSYFHDNHNGFPGIADEISDGPGIIQNNTFLNNDNDIGIWESKAVTIVNNVMNGGSGTPFMFRTMTNRCENPSGENVANCQLYYQIKNLVVHNNKVKNWTGCLINDPAYSANPQYADPLFTTLNIQMDYDDIYTTASGPCWLGWEGEPSVSSFAGLQSTLNIEAHGTQAAF
jgi:hypothetical protein